MISGHLCCLYLSLEWKQWGRQDTSRHLFQVCATLSEDFPHTSGCCLRWAAGFAHLTVQDFSKKRRFLSFVYGKPLSVITFVWYASNVMIMTKRQAGRASFLISWVERCFQVLDNKARLNSFIIFVNTGKVFKIGKLNIVPSKNCPALNSTCHRFSETKMFSLSKQLYHYV